MWVDTESPASSDSYGLDKAEREPYSGTGSLKVTVGNRSNIKIRNR